MGSKSTLQWGILHINFDSGKGCWVDVGGGGGLALIIQVLSYFIFGCLI